MPRIVISRRSGGIRGGSPHFCGKVLTGREWPHRSPARSNRSGGARESHAFTPAATRRRNPQAGGNSMRKVAVALAATALVALALVAALLRGSGPGAASASSHREAPLISE